MSNKREELSRIKQQYTQHSEYGSQNIQQNDDFMGNDISHHVFSSSNILETPAFVFQHSSPMTSSNVSPVMEEEKYVNDSDEQSLTPIIRQMSEMTSNVTVNINMNCNTFASSDPTSVTIMTDHQTNESKMETNSNVSLSASLSTLVITDEQRNEKKMERERSVFLKSEKRVNDLQKQRIRERRMQSEKEQLRDIIVPKILERARMAGNNGISLLKIFYPALKIKHNCMSKKQICRAFKKTVANFHPDRTVKKSLVEQIEAEEIFKFLSEKKDMILGVNGNFNGYCRSSRNQKKNKYRGRGGWF